MIKLGFKFKLLGFALMAAVSVASMAQGPAVKLKGLKIQADDEAPQVMHIIPWQNPIGAERLYTPVRGMEVERLKPLDPYTFELEQTLHSQFQQNQQASEVSLSQ